MAFCIPFRCRTSGHRHHHRVLLPTWAITMHNRNLSDPTRPRATTHTIVSIKSTMATSRVTVNSATLPSRRGDKTHSSTCFELCDVILIECVDEGGFKVTSQGTSMTSVTAMSNASTPSFSTNVKDAVEDASSAKVHSVLNALSFFTNSIRGPIQP